MSLVLVIPEGPTGTGLLRLQGVSGIAAVTDAVLRIRDVLPLRVERVPQGHYPVVFEQEDSGVYSAYLAGLPVYAQAAKPRARSSGH